MEKGKRAGGGEEGRLMGGDHMTQRAWLSEVSPPHPTQLTHSLVLAPWTDVCTLVLPRPAHLFCILVTLPPNSPLISKEAPICMTHAGWAGSLVPGQVSRPFLASLARQSCFSERCWKEQPAYPKGTLRRSHRVQFACLYRFPLSVASRASEVKYF